MKKILSIALIILMVAALLTGCGDKPSGEYKSKDIDVTISFKGDEFTLQTKGYEVSGKYEISEEEITFKSGEKSQTVSFENEVGAIVIDGTKYEKV